MSNVCCTETIIKDNSKSKKRNDDYNKGNNNCANDEKKN